MPRLIYHCPRCFCGSPMDLQHGHHGIFYACRRQPESDGRQPCRSDGSPSGSVTDRELRSLRVQAHKLLDSGWRNAPSKLVKKKRREACYRKLARMMGLTEDQCHIGLFDKEQCRQAIVLLEESRQQRVRDQQIAIGAPGTQLLRIEWRPDEQKTLATPAEAKLLDVLDRMFSDSVAQG